MMDVLVQDAAGERATITAIPEHLANLRRFAVSLTHNNADADDLLQDTLTRAVEKISRYHEGTNLRAWLFAIMHNPLGSRFHSLIEYAARAVADVILTRSVKSSRN